MCLFLTMPWVGRHCVIVAFPGHTHLTSINMTQIIWKSDPIEYRKPTQIKYSRPLYRVSPLVKMYAVRTK